MTACCG